MKLLIYRGESLERTLDLTDRDVRIGRGAENDVVLEDPEKTVSRFHAEMRPEPGGWVLFDLNSQNGIWINGERIQRQVLNPGQYAQLGNFRIMIDGGANVAAPPPAAPAPEAMAATMVFSRDAAGAPAPAAAPAAPTPAAAAPGGGPPPPPPPAPIAAAVAPKRPKLTPTGGDPKKGLTSIPRPIFYGGALFFLLLIIGVMYVMRPHPPQPPPEPPPPQNQQASTPDPTPPPPPPNAGGGPESNEDIVARNLKEAKEKLDANDPVAAIEAINKALMVDPGNAAALDLKMKAEEKRAAGGQTAGGQTAGGQAGSNGAGTGTGATAGAGTAGGGTAGGAATGGATAGSGTAGAGTAGAGTAGAGSTGGAATGGATAGAGTTGGEATVDPKVRAAAQAAARKEKAAKEAAAALQRRYLQGKAEMTRGDYEHAIIDLEAVLKEKPGYQDTASLLDQARGLRRADAQKQLSAANAAAGKGDYAAAMAAYQRASKIDPNLAGLQEGMAGVRQKMRDEGEAAYRRARQLDAVGRTQDALPLYQRAVTLLPADDPSGKAARDRLEALKGQNP